MKCSNCQKENSPGALFCAECGTKLEVEVVNSIEATPIPVVSDTPLPVASNDVSTPLPMPTPIPPGGKVGKKQKHQKKIKKSKAPKAPKEKKPKKRKSKVLLIVILIIIISLAISAFFVFGKELSFFKSPEDKMADAIFKTFEARSGEIHAIFKFDDLTYESDNPEQDKIFEDLLKDLEISNILKFDGKEQELEGELGIEIKGTTLANIGYYVNNEYLILDAPIISDEPIAIDLPILLQSIIDGSKDEGLSDLIGGEEIILGDMSDLTEKEELVDLELFNESYMDYKDMFDRDIYKSYDDLDWEPYKEYMIPYYESAIDDVEKGRFEMDFDDEISYRGISYTIDYDRDDAEELSEDLAEVFINDDHIKDFIEEIISVLVERIVDNKDYIMYALLAEESMDEIDEWDKDYEDELEDIRDDMIDDMDDKFDELEDEKESKKEELLDNEDVDIDTALDDATIKQTIRIDNDGYIRSNLMEISGEVENLEEGTITFEAVFLAEALLFDEKVKIEGIDKEDAIDYGAMSEEEKEEFMEEIMMKLFGELQNNPIFEDMTSEGINF